MSAEREEKHALATQIKLKEVCSICGKSKQARGNAVTSWLFRSHSCACADSGSTAQTRAGGRNSRAEEGNARSGDGARTENTNTRAGGRNSRTQEGKARSGEGNIRPSSALAKPQPDRPLPAIAEHFEVLDLIGEGGMSRVYKVRDTRNEKVFAVKILKHEGHDAARAARFEREIKAAQELSHGNLVSIYDCGITPDGASYAVMDFIDGQSLADILAAEVFVEPQRALDLFSQICEGVAYAHSRGIIHLDLKPSNILVVKTGDAEIVKVVDFGIARVVTDDAQALSETEEIVGSLLYMSPEQCRGSSLDSRSDIYSLGCLMYEVLTGKAPFAAENPVKTIIKHLQDDPKTMRKHLKRLDVPASLETVVLHCLRKEAKNRYQFMEELIKDLELVRHGREPVVAHQQSYGKEKKKDLAPRQKIAAFVLFAAVAVGYFLALSPYDTISQANMLLVTLWQSFMLWCLFVAFSYVRRYTREISLRLKDSATALAGDRWFLFSTRSLQILLLLLCAFPIDTWLMAHGLGQSSSLIARLGRLPPWQQEMLLALIAGPILIPLVLGLAQQAKGMLWTKFARTDEHQGRGRESA